MIYRALFLSLLSLFLACGQPFQLSAADAPGKGQTLYICGHSFNWFIGEPLQALALEAGYKDHKTVGITRLGDSRPIDHWNVPDKDNTAKKVLEAGQVDILTLAPHREMPDRGIELFADLAFEHNPAVHVMLQISWPDFPMKAETNWEEIPAKSKAYLERARTQAGEINKRHGKTEVTLVPVAPALLALRGMILAGTFPGIKNFGELFVDEKGHPAKTLADLTTFCWFAAIYHQTPVGLKALDVPGDEGSVARNRILQQIAWDVVQQEPLNGFTAGM